MNDFTKDFERYQASKQKERPVRKGWSKWFRTDGRNGGGWRRVWYDPYSNGYDCTDRKQVVFATQDGQYKLIDTINDDDLFSDDDRFHLKFSNEAQALREVEEFTIEGFCGVPQFDGERYQAYYMLVKFNTNDEMHSTEKEMELDMIKEHVMRFNPVERFTVEEKMACVNSYRMPTTPLEDEECSPF